MCGGFGTGANHNPCSCLIALLILFYSGVLCNDRAWILILLFLLCSGCNQRHGVYPYGVGCSC